jgi:hypothetical protein
MNQRFELDENDIREAIAFFLASRKDAIVHAKDITLKIDPGDPGHYGDNGPKVHATALVSGSSSRQR